MIIPSLNYYYTLHQYTCNEVHRKTDTLFPGNNMTVAELKPLTIRSGGSSSNHYATLPSLKKKRVPSLKGLVFFVFFVFLRRQCGVLVRAWASWIVLIKWSVIRVQLQSYCFLERECLFFYGLHCSYNTYRMVNPNQLLYHKIKMFNELQVV